MLLWSGVDGPRALHIRTRVKIKNNNCDNKNNNQVCLISNK